MQLRACQISRWIFCLLIFVVLLFSLLFYAAAPQKRATPAPPTHALKGVEPARLGMNSSTLDEWDGAVYIMTLPERRALAQHAERQLHDAGFGRVVHFDGVSTSDSRVTQLWAQLNGPNATWTECDRKFGRRMTPAPELVAIHFTVLDWLKLVVHETSHRRAIMFEDDVMLHVNFSRLFPELMAELGSVPVVHLGRSQHGDWAEGTSHVTLAGASERWQRVASEAGVDPGDDEPMQVIEVLRNAYGGFAVVYERTILRELLASMDRYQGPFDSCVLNPLLDERRARGEAPDWSTEPALAIADLRSSTYQRTESLEELRSNERRRRFRPQLYRAHYYPPFHVISGCDEGMVAAARRWSTAGRRVVWFPDAGSCRPRRQHSLMVERVRRALPWFDGLLFHTWNMQAYWLALLPHNQSSEAVVYPPVNRVVENRMDWLDALEHLFAGTSDTSIRLRLSSWERLPQNATNPSEVYAARTRQGDVFSFGGFVTGTLEVAPRRRRQWDRIAGQWVDLGPLWPGTPETHVNCVALEDGRAVCAGGQFGPHCSPAVDDLFLLDLRRGRRVVLARLPEARYTPLLGLAPKSLTAPGKRILHVIGGGDPSRAQPVSTHWSIDLNWFDQNGSSSAGMGSAPAWVVEENLPIPCMHCSGVVIGRYFYVFGGNRGDSLVNGTGCGQVGHDHETPPVLEDVFFGKYRAGSFIHHLFAFKFNFKTKQWTRLADIPLALGHAEEATLKVSAGPAEHVLVLGGSVPRTIHGQVRLSDKILFYNVTSDKWSILDQTLPSPSCSSVAWLDGNKLYYASRKLANVFSTLIEIINK